MSKDRQPPITGPAELVTRLDQLGIYKYTAPSRVAVAKASGRANGYLYLYSRRDFDADEEDLAEGHVADLVRRIRPFLRDQGVPVRSVRQHFTDHGPYTVTVDRADFLIYTLDESHSDDLWAAATGRTLLMINTLLDNAGSKERAYFLYGWNDGVVVFLTPEMFELIRVSPWESDKDKPYQPRYSAPDPR